LLCLCILCVIYVLFCVFCVNSVVLCVFVCKCALYYCYRASTQLQLTNISHRIIFSPTFLEGFIFLISVYTLNAARVSAFSNYVTLKIKFRVKVNLPLHMSGKKAGGVDIRVAPVILNLVIGCRCVVIFAPRRCTL